MLRRVSAQLWDRRPDETDASWAAFTAYRDMPPATRSITAARASVGGRPSANRTWERWSGRYGWHHRAPAYDAFLDSIRRDERERGYRDEERLLFQRRQEWQEREFRVSSKLLERVEEGLASGRMFRTVQNDDGEGGSIVITEPMDWSLHDLARVATLASRRGRLVLDLHGDPARAPTPEPQGSGTSDVERFVDALVADALAEPEVAE